MVAVAAVLEIVAEVIETAVKLGPTVIQGVEDAKPFAQALIDTLMNKKVISQTDLDALEAKVDALSAQLQEPLPKD